MICINLWNWYSVHLNFYFTLAHFNNFVHINVPNKIINKLKHQNHNLDYKGVFGVLMFNLWTNILSEFINNLDSNKTAFIHPHPTHIFLESFLCAVINSNNNDINISRAMRLCNHVLYSITYLILISGNEV